MTMVVRPRMSFSRASCTRRSLSVSRAEVASSRIRIAGSFEDGAGNADALALASRKTAAAVADHGVVAPGVSMMKSWALATRAASSTRAPGWRRPSRRQCC